MRLAAGIIAGGAALRFGGVAKPLLVVGPAGERILDRQLAALRALTPHIVLSTNAPELYAAFGLPIVPDAPDHAGAGPLAGLAALLAAAPAGFDRILVVAGDMPDLAPAPLAVLVAAAAADAACDIVAPVIDGRPEPLCAVYHPRVRARVLARLAAGQRKVASLLEDPALRVTRLGPEAFAAADPTLRFLRNVNSPVDLGAPPL